VTVAASRTERLFTTVTARPRLVVILALIAIAICAAGLSRLVKDTSVKAFIPDGHPSLVADNKARDIFGLSDTIAIAVVATDGATVFEPDTLALIAGLSDELAALPNIRYDRIASLATESSIDGDDGSVEIDPYIDPYELSAALAESSRVRWRRMPPHQGTLVSDDERGALIMAEVIDSDRADQTYQATLQLVADIDVSGIEIHVAGPAAVSGYLSRYIDRDARKLQPLVFVVVLGFIYLAFRRFVALPGPLFVVAGSTAGALGLMAWSGIPYYAITNALPVIIVAISVADAIHVLSSYYQLKEQAPDATTRALVVQAMTSMARPITLTTLTTIAGFGGIAIASIMPPITWFAVFASIGVALAWAFSIFVLPNVMLIVDPGRSPSFASWADNRPSELGRLLARTGSYSPLRYGSVLFVFVVICAVAVLGALRLEIDRSQVDNFAPDEPIRIADELINDRFAGTAILDVIVETDQPEGLLDADRMQKISDLQTYFETLPHVEQTVSIVDYLSQLHHVIEQTDAVDRGRRILPETDDAIGQYLFLYEVTGDPTDLEEEIDRDYRAALIRGVLDAHYFSENRRTVEALRQYIRDSFDEPGLSATLAGDVNVSYHWMQRLKTSHFESVGLSLALVLAMSILAFRSVAAGVVSVIPVMFTVLVLYACMGYLGVHLEPATSMFAAIALGVGVDFAIHLVDRLRSATQALGGDIAKAIDTALPPVARACFFNSAALGIGFAVLLVSDLPTLIRFGGLVTLASFTSYIAALVIVPALFAAGHAWFGPGMSLQPRTGLPAVLTAIGIVVGALAADNAFASPHDADAIAQNVAAREEGAATRRRIAMTLTDRRGRSEERLAVVHRQNTDAARQTRITFLEPKRSRDFSFLSHDPLDSGAQGNRWMYSPFERKVRRIPASDRGDSFMGTDFSYEDVQSQLKFALDDWDFGYVGKRTVDGHEHYEITGRPQTQRIARELGYGGFTATIDATTWMPLRIEFVDIRERPLKRIEVREIERIDGVWTPRDIVATNHRTGHSTRFRFQNVEYLPALSARLFDPQALTRSLPGAGSD